jgi:replication factor A1
LDAGSVPEVTYTYVELANLGDRQKDDVVGKSGILTRVSSNPPPDVIAVVHKVQDVQEILTKQGKQLSKRELTLADRSGYTCQLTLWGKQAEQWAHDDNPVVACKGLKVSDFGGKCFPTISVVHS